jgi:hypothetical protein
VVEPGGETCVSYASSSFYDLNKGTISLPQTFGSEFVEEAPFTWEFEEYSEPLSTSKDNFTFESTKSKEIGNITLPRNTIPRNEKPSRECTR